MIDLRTIYFGLLADACKKEQPEIEEQNRFKKLEQWCFQNDDDGDKNFYREKNSILWFIYNGYCLHQSSALQI